MGGELVEALNDVALRVCPISERDAIDMIAQVRGSALLNGFRGRPRADVDALAETLVSVSHMAAQMEGTLSELEINPLAVLPEGQGVSALDALATLRGNSR